MGLTASSTGTKIKEKDFSEQIKKCNYTIAIAGNPNVGKSTIFNGLTGMHQHTGNWPGKTVGNASGICHFHKKDYLLVDIPGTYSLMSHSEEEEIARDYICFSNPDATVVILDATCLERNLNLVYQTMEITPNIIVCVNLLDEAKKKGIYIDLDLLETELGVPVVGTIARKPKTLKALMEKVEAVCEKKIIPTPYTIQYLSIIENCVSFLQDSIFHKLTQGRKYLSRWICLKLIDGDEKILNSINQNIMQGTLWTNSENRSDENDSLIFKVNQVKSTLLEQNINEDNFKDTIVSSIVFHSENVSQDVCLYEKEDYRKRDQKIDKILTSKTLGIPIMLLFLGFIFWITITGANYPSQLLSTFFGFLEEKILILLSIIHLPAWITSLLIDGVYRTLTWIIAVMLPPMAIFFPLFTLLEDLGLLPRIAFNMDNCFRKVGSSGKQSLTMCMGVTDWVIFFSIVGILDQRERSSVQESYAKRSVSLNQYPLPL